MSSGKIFAFPFRIPALMLVFRPFGLDSVEMASLYFTSLDFAWQAQLLSKQTIIVYKTGLNGLMFG